MGVPMPKLTGVSVRRKPPGKTKMTTPLLCGDAITTGAILTTVMALFDVACDDERAGDFYTDVVWNVSARHNVDLQRVRDEFQDYMMETGLWDVFEDGGWTMGLDVEPQDDTPLRIRFQRKQPGDHTFPNWTLFKRMSENLHLTVLRMIPA